MPVLSHPATIIIYIAPSGYSIPDRIVAILKELGIVKGRSRKDTSTEYTQIKDILHHVGVTEFRHIGSLPSILDHTTMLAYGKQEAHPEDDEGEDQPGEYLNLTYVGPLSILYNWWTKNSLTTDTPSYDELMDYTIATTHHQSKTGEPRIYIVELPPLPHDHADWFSWRHSTEIQLAAAGGYRVISDKRYAKEHPQASLKVKAMLMAAVAASNGYEIAQFIIPEKATERDCGYAIWQAILVLFETGPIIDYHIKAARARSININCGETLKEYMKFSKDFMALRNQYTTLLKTAKDKKMKINGITDTMDWNIAFKEKMRYTKAPLAAMQAVPDVNQKTLHDTFIHIMVILQEQERKPELRIKDSGAKNKQDKEQAKQSTPHGNPTEEVSPAAIRKGLIKQIGSITDPGKKAQMQAVIDQLGKGNNRFKKSKKRPNEKSGDGGNKKRRRNADLKAKEAKTPRGDGNNAKTVVNRAFAQMFDPDSD